MATYKIQDTTLSNIANAIRSKMGSTSSLTPEEMASAIALISGEGGGTEISFLLEDNITKVKLADILAGGILINNKVSLQVLLNDIAIWGAKAEFTNMLRFALTRDETGIYGGDYNGDGTNDGYQKSRRLSSSATNNESSADAAMCASGFIPVKVNQIVRLANWTPKTSVASYFMTFNKDKTKLYHNGFQQSGDWVNNSSSTWYDYKNKIMTIPVTEAMGGADIEFFRFSGCMTDDTIATVDEEIEL